MLKRFRILGVALAATLFMAASARAATLIDFRDADAVVVGGTVQYFGSDAIGTGIGIGQVFIDDAFAFNGVHDVTGNNGGFGELQFNTFDNTISITGCIAELGVGIDEETGDCVPVVLMSGEITFQNVSGNTGFGFGAIALGGFDTKNAELLIAIGLSPDTPFTFFGSDITSIATQDGFAESNSVDIANTPIPEPATMMLLGTGLLAAFRARRRHA